MSNPKPLATRLSTLENQYQIILEILKDQKEKNEYFEKIIEDQNGVINNLKNELRKVSVRTVPEKKCPDCGVTVKFGRCYDCYKKCRVPPPEKSTECLI